MELQKWGLVKNSTEVIAEEVFAEGDIETVGYGDLLGILVPYEDFDIASKNGDWVGEKFVYKVGSDQYEIVQMELTDEDVEEYYG